MSDLYDADVLAWSERQAELLRRHAAGERLNEQPDWANIIEEIEDVGRSQLSGVQSLLVQAMAQALKARGWPDSVSVPHWEAEARGFRADARRDFSPSMRHRTDIARLYAQALDRLPDRMDGKPPQALPETCPVTLDQLLGPERDVSFGMARSEREDCD
jgi:hypothetical protein